MKIFNTEFENSLRIILLLSYLDEPVSFFRIKLLDFLCLHGKELLNLPMSLNGTTEFLKNEYDSKDEVLKESIKHLVLDGMIIPKLEEKNFTYQVTEVGRQIASRLLASEYGFNYAGVVNVAVDRFKSYTDNELETYVNKIVGSKMKG